MGPVFKQRRLGLLGSNAQKSFKIICKYPLWDELLYLKKGDKLRLSFLAPGSPPSQMPSAVREHCHYTPCGPLEALAATHLG